MHNALRMNLKCAQARCVTPSAIHSIQFKDNHKSHTAFVDITYDDAWEFLKMKNEQTTTSCKQARKESTQ